MAKRKEKKENFKELSVEELQRELSKTQDEFFKLKFRSASAPLKNVMRLRDLRKNIARIHTYINQKRSHAV